MKTIQELVYLIRDWSNQRNIPNESTVISQLNKTQDELKELLWEAEEVELDNTAFKLELGDVIVTLIIAAQIAQVDVTECLNLTWNKIKDRRGKMIDGQFVKEEDYKND